MIGNKQSIKVPCERIDTFCINNNISNIDVMKIDTEGCTYEVLLGCGNILNNISLLHIETESTAYFENQKLHNETIKILQDNNWEMLKITTALSVIQHDSIWINKRIL